MTPENQRPQDILDQEHLRLLSLFYYVRAGTTAVIACIPLIHVMLGLGMILASPHIPTKPHEPPLALIGWLFLGIGLTIVTLGWLFAALEFLAGRFIGRRQHRTFCLVIAGVGCLGIPYGTVLGVMTFLVLQRDTVRALFAPTGSPATNPAGNARPPDLPAAP